jgi:prophage regulatory protein
MPKRAVHIVKPRRATHPAGIPETGFLRLTHIVGDPHAVPPVPAIVPIGKSSWWAGVKTGKYPAAIKLGPKTTVWTVESIRELLEQHKQAA